MPARFIVPCVMIPIKSTGVMMAIDGDYQILTYFFNQTFSIFFTQAHFTIMGSFVRH